MKRKSKRINLHRETVRNLSNDELAAGVGAARPLPVSWNCTITQTAPCQANTRVPICIRF